MASRRDFLQAIAGGGLSAASGQLSAQDVQLPRDGIRMNPDTQDLVKLIDRTPREQCQALLVNRFKAGVPYRELLSAVFFFAVLRDGHHSVYLVHSAHQLSLDLQAADRMLPLFWAVDVMKEHLTRFGNKQVGPLAGPFPSPSQADGDFADAMKSMDREKSERAIIAISRTQGSQQAYAKILRYAARDDHFIGHIPIAIVSAGRVLNTIGWHHAEPTLRYIIRDMYRNDHTLKGQPYPHNVQRADETHDKLPHDWASDQRDAQRAVELLTLMRKGKWWNSNEWIATNLISGSIKAGTVWDAIHLLAAEMMLRFAKGGRRLGNRSLHNNTAANALHHVFANTLDSRSRYITMLQAVSWATEFMLVEQNRGEMRSGDIAALKPVELTGDMNETTSEILSSLPPRIFLSEQDDRTGQDKAAELAFALSQSGNGAKLLIKTIRHSLTYRLSINAHEMKFPIAMLEEYNRIGPTWRPHLLAATTVFLQGSNSAPNPAVERGFNELAKTKKERVIVSP